MGSNTPPWLDASYVQGILRNSENDKSIQVSGITVRPATAKGDNYSSEMHRVAVEFSRVVDGHEISEKTSLIVKVLPNDIRQELIESNGVFATEMSMMAVTLPKMTEMLQKFGPASLAARHFYSQYEKPTQIVVEDLAAKSFRMADRHAGLDLDHSILALKNLGRFHAASVALKEQDPEAFSNYKTWSLHKDRPPMVGIFFNSSTKALAEESAKWSELSPRITEKLFKLAEYAFEKGCEAAVYREDEFNVLNHGDFWVNNMMFRYDEQRRPIDHIFVDFQISNYGSPAIDLLYFLGTSPIEDIRFNNRELLLREYHTSLTKTMTKLGCKTEAPSIDKLQEILKQRAMCEVIAAMTVLPFVVLEEGEEILMDNVLDKDKKYENVGYRGKSYRKIMTRLLPLFDSMGLLDV